MYSTMTMTAFNENTSLNGKKTAKLGQMKVVNIREKYRTKYSEISQRNDLGNDSVKKQNVGTPISKNYNRVLLPYNMVVLNNGNHMMANAKAARKLKVNQVVREGAMNAQMSAIKDGVAIKNNVVEFPTLKAQNIPPVSIPSVNNVVDFPAPRLQNIEPAQNVEVAKPVDNVRELSTTRTQNMPSMSAPSGNTAVEFPGNKMSMSNQTFVGNENNSFNNLSRVSRMDYTAGAVDSVERQPERVNNVSVDDYLQHSSLGINDKDIAELVQKNEKLDSEIVRNQSILENLEAELKRIQVIREEKRKAQISALEEEELSKTATLKGLTEQIRALQEAIKQEQNNLNAASSYKKDSNEPYSFRRVA